MFVNCVSWSVDNDNLTETSTQGLGAENMLMRSHLSDQVIP